MQEEHPLQVARCTKIINAGQDDAKYVINVKQYAKFVVALGDKVSPTDIEEGMRVGVERQKYKIQVSASIDRVRTVSTAHMLSRSLTHFSSHAAAFAAKDRPHGDNDAS